MHSDAYPSDLPKLPGMFSHPLPGGAPFFVEDKLRKTKTVQEVDQIFQSVIANWLSFAKEFCEVQVVKMRRFNFYRGNQATSPMGMGGVKLKLWELSQKIPNFRAYVCESLLMFRSCLKILKEDQFEGKVAFLVSSYQFKEPSTKGIGAHLTAVLVEKKEGLVKIALLDTLGEGIRGSLYLDKFSEEFVKCRDELNIYEYGDEYESTTYCPLIYQNLYHMIEEAELVNYRVYIYRPERQVDKIACSEFAVHDAACFFQGDLFEHLEAIPKEHGKGRYFSVDKLPPEYMKLTQSIRKLKDYEEQLPDQVKDHFKEVTQASYRIKNATESERSESKFQNEEAKMRFIKSLDFVLRMFHLLKDSELRDIEEAFESFAFIRKFKNSSRESSRESSVEGFDVELSRASSYECDLEE